MFDFLSGPSFHHFIFGEILVTSVSRQKTPLIVMVEVIRGGGNTQRTTGGIKPLGETEWGWCLIKYKRGRIPVVIWKGAPTPPIQSKVPAGPGVKSHSFPITTANKLHQKTLFFYPITLILSTDKSNIQCQYPLYLIMWVYREITTPGYLLPWKTILRLLIM